MAMKRALAFFACAGAAVLALLLTSSSGHTQGQFGPNGDITGVTAGSGILGGATRGNATVAVDQAYVQRRFTAACGGGSAVQSVDVAGVPTCVAAGGVTDGDKTDITVSVGGTTWTIDGGAVTLAKMANVATATIFGRVTAGTGTPEALTSTQATTLCDTFSTSATTKGCVPGSNSGGASVFLNGNGGWTAPTGNTYTAGDGLTVTGNDFDLTYTSDFTISTDQLDLSTAVTAPGSLSTAGAFTAGDADTDVQTFNGNSSWNAPAAGNSITTAGPVQVNSSITTSSYVYSGGSVYAGAGTIMHTGGDISFLYTTNAHAEGKINIVGYNESTTQTRSLGIYDGTGSAAGDRIALFDGTNRSVTFDAAATIGGATTDNHTINGDVVLAGGNGTELTVTGQGIFTADLTTNGNLQSDGNSTLGNGTGDAVIIGGGEIRDTGAAPSSFTCGTTPSAAGGRNVFRVTMGSGTATTCAVTFSTAFTATPVCTLERGGSTARADMYISAISASAITIANDTGANMASTVVHVQCVGL